MRSRKRKRKAGLDLKAPCDQCPYTANGVKLRSGMALELANNALDEANGEIFSCHKSVYAENQKLPEQVCAGFIEFGLKQGIYSKPVAIGIWLGLINEEDHKKGMERVFSSTEEMIECHKKVMP